MRTLNTFNLFDEIDGYFNRAYDERNFQPACDVAESDDHFLMSFDLPGIRKEDLKIEASGNLLTISGEKRRDWSGTDDQHKVQRIERSHGFFKRSFTLPSSIEHAKIEAQYKDGVLSLYLPKASTAKTRQIEIKTGEDVGFFGKLLHSNKDKN